MTRLRHFEKSDAEALTRLQGADMPVEAVHSLIRQWNPLEYQGRFFEMFAKKGREVYIFLKTL